MKRILVVAALAVFLGGCAETSLPARTSTIRVIDGGACGALTWPVVAPHARARVVSIDTASARARAGVPQVAHVERVYPGTCCPPDFASSDVEPAQPAQHAEQLA